jgi:hypothetical protein
VSVSIPIFSKFVEKSRDAVSVNNIRSVYSEAAATSLTLPQGYLNSYWENGEHHLFVNCLNGKCNAIDVVVEIEGGKKNHWSGMGDHLPGVLKNVDDTAEEPGKYLMVFPVDQSGNINSAVLEPMLDEWKKFPDLY